MRKFINVQITRGTHPSIGWAVAEALNSYNPGLEVAGMIYHPPDPACVWREDRGEFVEMILDFRKIKE